MPQLYSHCATMSSHETIHHTTDINKQFAGIVEQQDLLSFENALEEEELGYEGPGKEQVQEFINDESKTALDLEDKGLQSSDLENIFVELNKEINGKKPIDRLIDLSCSENELTRLPELPSSLKHLYCQNNQLTSLPKLPESLKFLSCQDNQLTSLPKLPESLKFLYCHNNQLTSLPKLPESLKSLKCYDNSLKKPPKLTRSIVYIEFGNNLLEELPEEITQKYSYEFDHNTSPVNMYSNDMKLQYNNLINTQQSLTNGEDKNYPVYQLYYNETINSLPFGSKMEEIMQLLSEKNKEWFAEGNKKRFVSYQLKDRSSMISKTIADGYRWYISNTDKAKQAYGKGYNYEHAVYPLIEFATTPELISLMGNHDINLNYSFNKSVKTIRERIEKETQPNNNVFFYIDNLRPDRYNDEVKTFLKQQFIIGLILKDTHKAKLQSTIESYDKEKTWSLIEGLLNSTDKQSLRYNYIMQGLTVLQGLGFAENIAQWFRSKPLSEQLSTLVLAKLDNKGEQLYSSLITLAPNIKEADINTIVQSMGGIEIESQKKHNDVMFLYVGNGHGGGQERITNNAGEVYRCPAEEKFLNAITVPESGKTLAQTQSDKLKTLRTTGNVEFDVEDLGGNSDNYRKSEVLRYAEEWGFDTIDPACTGGKEIPGRKEMSLLQRQKTINELFKTNNFIILQDVQGVRASFVMHNKISPEQRDELFSIIKPDYACVRGHTGMTDPAINAWKDKRPPECYILDGGCRNAFKMDGYEVPNQILAYTATARACTTLYTTDIVIDHIRRLRSDKNYSKSPHQRAGVINTYNQNEERKKNFFVGEKYSSDGYQSYQGDYMSKNIKLPGIDIQAIDRFARNIELVEQLSKNPENTTIDNSLIEGKKTEVVDSTMDRKQAIGWHILKQSPRDAQAYTEFKEIIESQRMINVPYYGFDKKLHQGQIVVHKNHVQDTKDFFSKALELKFPIAKVIPISHPNYKGSDDLSMADNNNTGFNYRQMVGGESLSQHAYGKAIDINPVQNPYFPDAKNNGSYNEKNPGTLSEKHPLVLLMKNKGYTRGGDWSTPKDYQHFEKE